MLASLLIAAGLVVALVAMASPAKGDPPLRLRCAAVLRPAMEQITRDYERERGVQILAQYGGSGHLLGGLQISHHGDLFMPADESYLDAAGELVVQRTPVVMLRSVLAVARGNPLGVSSLADLSRPDVRVGLADPDGASIGKLSREALQDEGLWEHTLRAVLVFKPTVSEIAADLAIGAIDATILWNQTAASIDAIEAVSDPALSRRRGVVSIGLLRASTRPEEAKLFAAYVAGPARIRFEEFGYTLGGDP